jgi:hypothetical protein
MKYGVTKRLLLTPSSIVLNQIRSQNVQFVIRLYDDPVGVWTPALVYYNTEVLSYCA